jgi:predicted membrane protein
MNNQAAFIFANDDYINTTAVFGGIKKSIISKDFRGGKINNIFGATELDFTHADLAGVAILDISQGFGEVKIKVPQDWWVEADTTQIFATVEDNRANAMKACNSNKILVLRGISFFGVVEILSSL